MNNMANHSASQELTLKNRKELTVTGVKKINSLNPDLFDIETVMGRMRIDGKDLEMLSLDIESGILIINGTVNQIAYTEQSKGKKDASFLAKLFK